MAALGPEAARAAPPVRRAVTECLGDVLDTIAGADAGRRPRARGATTAIRLFAGLVGAMVVARAVDDPALSDEVLGGRARRNRPLVEMQPLPPPAVL